MDEYSYQRALDGLCFSEDMAKAHYYNTDQDREGNDTVDWKPVDSLKDQLSDMKFTSSSNSSHNSGLDIEAKANFRLLIGSGNGDSQNPLSIGRELFEQTMSGAGFPKLFAEALKLYSGSCACFRSHEKVGDTVSPSFLSVIVKTPNISTLAWTLVMRVNIVDRSATGLLFVDMNDRDMSRILKRLHERQESLRENPLVMLVILLDEFGRQFENCHKVEFQNVMIIEMQTRMTSMIDSPASPEPVQVDYGQLNKDIHYCNDQITGTLHFSDIEQTLGKFVKETLNKFEAAREKRGLEPDPHDVLYQYIDYRLNATEMSKVEIRSYQHRIQSQMSVVYNMMAQRDNKLNISVAEDSKKIAAAAKRDSSAMKTVSILTLVFLPGTFVAAIFSAGIFHFESATSNSIVSELWWVYFVVSGILTFVTIGIWVVYMRWRNSSIRQEEEAEKKFV